MAAFALALLAGSLVIVMLLLRKSGRDPDRSPGLLLWLSVASLMILAAATVFIVPLHL